MCFYTQCVLLQWVRKVFRSLRFSTLDWVINFIYLWKVNHPQSGFLVYLFAFIFLQFWPVFLSWALRSPHTAWYWEHCCFPLRPTFPPSCYESFKCLSFTKEWLLTCNHTNPFQIWHPWTRRSRSPMHSYQIGLCCQSSSRQRNIFAWYAPNQ